MVHETTSTRDCLEHDKHNVKYKNDLLIDLEFAAGHNGKVALISMHCLMKKSKPTFIVRLQNSLWEIQWIL